METIGITPEGVKVALSIKEHYKQHQPICVPGERASILVPEHLLNQNLDLRGFEDPLPLAMVAARDPEPPMALAAAARLSPLGRGTKLVSGVFEMVGEATRHPMVRRCVELISESAFSPDAIATVRRHAAQFVVRTRQQYTAALRHNLQAILEGVIPPRQFVSEFFELTEAGNMRSDIRKKLIVSLLLSDNIRPSIKFLMLENFERLPEPVRMAIISEILRAKPTHHVELIKEELKWIITEERLARANN